jgi:hypothetical protein
VIELTLVTKKKISKKNFEAFLKGRMNLKFEEEIAWDENKLCVDQGNFEGVIMSFGGGEMMFVPNDHPAIDKILEADEIPGTHIHFPEIG